MSKEGKMELHEKTAKAEAAVCTDEEKRWCDIALSALPDDQAKRYSVIPQDVREFFAAFSARLESPALQHVYADLPRGLPCDIRLCLI